MRLVLVHGRQQQGKDPETEKETWLASIRRGMEPLGLELPVSPGDVGFAFYGDLLHSHESGLPDIDVVVRGDATLEVEEAAFAAQMLTEVCLRAGVDPSDPQFARDDILERGPLQNPLLRALLQALNAWAPGVGAALLWAATHDVYSYISNSALRERLDAGVRRAMAEDQPTVVVGHSLGSVVAHSVLRTWKPSSGQRVPLLLTLGSPLGVTVVQERLRARVFPSPVDRWMNAFDRRDVVALAPLADGDFPPGGVQNHDAVKNPSDDHHSIEGYLEDPVVARCLHDALRFGGSA